MSDEFEFSVVDETHVVAVVSMSQMHNFQHVSSFQKSGSVSNR